MSLKPYYEEAGITIYHADCREVLPTLSSVDLVLTDPPYGIGFVHGEGGGCLAQSTRFAGVAVHDDDRPFEPNVILGLASKTILWGANHYAGRLPSCSGWLVWDKRVQTCQNDQSDCELAWTDFLTTSRTYYHLWNGMLKASERGEPRVHPTQKPVALMRWCIRLAGTVKTILDPYSGSGTTLRAAKDMGLQATGIEIEERYCEIAAQRLRQEVLKFEEKRLPTAADLLGSDPDFTGELSTDDYMRKVRGREPARDAGIVSAALNSQASLTE